MAIHAAPGEYKSQARSEQLAIGVQQHYYGHVGQLAFRFYTDKEYNARASAEQNVRVDDILEMIEIPIDSKSVLRRPISNEDRYKLTHEYEQWKAGKQMAGMRIREWDLLEERPEIATSLEYHKIFTVEQFAECTPEKIGTFPMEIREFQAKAKQQVAAKKREVENSELVQQMNSELKSRDAEIEAMKAQMDELKAQWAESNGLSKQAGVKKPGKQKVAA